MMRCKSSTIRRRACCSWSPGTVWRGSRKTMLMVVASPGAYWHLLWTPDHLLHCFDDQSRVIAARNLLDSLVGILSQPLCNSICLDLVGNPLAKPLRLRFCRHQELRFSQEFRLSHLRRESFRLG